MRLAARMVTSRLDVRWGFGRACALLCSADAGYIVGQNLLIDGGAVNLTL